MQLNFDNFAELEDWIIKKHNAYEELRDENRQLEMDRMKDSDRIAQLEHIIFKLREEKETQTKTIQEIRGELKRLKPEQEVPKTLKKKATDGNQ